jgi:hypothetical protein
MKINKIFIGVAFALGILTSCKNQTVGYPDFDYQTVYFANQYPLRTLELGEDPNVDNSMDNLKKVVIKATTGGVQDNAHNILIDFKVDESLCTNLWFVASGSILSTNVLPMPSNYYTLTSNQIVIPKGSILDGVEVQLTDAFFADPKSLTNTYVIPLVMTKVQGADSILSGLKSVPNPLRVIDANWTITPKDFILYAVKYVNPWHGNYLRRGVDKITNTATAAVSTAVRHQQYVEKNDVVAATTNALNISKLSFSIKNGSGVTVPFDLILTFSNDGTCTVGGNSTNFDITGSGKFVSKGESNGIGGKPSSALYLDYSVNFKALNLTYQTKDTLVVRDRGVKPEYFTVIKN